MIVGCSRPSLPTLQKLVAEDFADRATRALPASELARRDQERVSQVLELRKQERLRTGEEKFLAASILQHGERPDDFLLAHELALAASGEGVKDARWLAASSQDRYRVSVGKPQLYGTQIQWFAERSRWELHPVDPSVTDEERARWDVRPLAESKELAARLNKEGLAAFKRSVDKEREDALRAVIAPSTAPLHRTSPSGP